MKISKPKPYGREYEAIEDVIQKQQNKLAFTFNYLLAAIVLIFLAQLYWSFQYKNVNLFVYTTVAIDLAYPFCLKLKTPRYPWKFIFLQGTLGTSLLYAAWTIMYPHKTYIYHIPQLLASIGKIYHQISLQHHRETATIVQNLINFQCKIQILIVLYAVLGYIIKFKLGWLKLLKIVLLILIFRLKYYQHYGCQLAWSQLHFFLDKSSRTLLVREYYQECSSKVSWLANRSNWNQVVIY